MDDSTPHLPKDSASVMRAVCEILQKDFECPPEKLTPEAKLFEELDLDSIDAIDLVAKLQKITGKTVSPEHFKQIRTLQDLVDAICKVLHS